MTKQNIQSYIILWRQMVLNIHLILLKHFTYVSNQLKNLAECFNYKNETLTNLLEVNFINK